jgi:thiamine kinase-like enzyme
MALSVEQAIARVPLWMQASTISSSFLHGGITNQNYRVEVDGEAFVVRIGGANTELLGIHRPDEYAAHQAAAGLGIAPEVIYFIEPEGYLVTRFVSGQPLSAEEIGRPENIRRVAEALRQVHNLPEIPATFSPFRFVEEGAKIARRYGVPFRDDFERLFGRLVEIEAAFRQDPFSPCLCHNDLLNANFLDDGRLWILDWEYAGMGDPLFDLANFAVHHDFSDEQEQLLLQAYFGEAAPARLARLKLMKIVSDFREAMWGMIQMGVSELDFDFRAYADQHFDRLGRNMGDARWEGWLNDVGRKA